jgi:RNA polymerase sigma factor (sigma-70 family)
VIGTILRRCVDLSVKARGPDKIPFVKTQQVPIRPNDTHAPAAHPEVRLGARALFHEVLSYVLLTLHRLGVPKVDREDLAQRIITEAYAKRQEYISARASPRQWVHGITVNQFRNYRRRQYRAKELFVKTTRDLADETPNAADQYEVETQRRLLYEVLFPQVEIDYLTVLIAHALDGLDFKIIAREQDISVSSAHERYQRGIMQLRKAYDRHCRNQKRRGLVVLPFALEQMLAADRTIPDAPADVEERLWNRMERARQWRARGQAFRAALGHPWLRSATTFVAGGIVGAFLYAALQPTPRPSPIVLNQSVQADSTQRSDLGAVASSTTTPPVALLPASPSSSAPREGDSEEQRLFDSAHQAFARRDFDLALKTLAVHERRFPAATFAAERELMRAKIAEAKRSRSAAPEPQTGSALMAPRSDAPPITP